MAAMGGPNALCLGMRESEVRAPAPEPVPAGNACYHCGAEKTETYLQHDRDHRFDVVQCAGCGFLRLRQQPSPKELESFYQESYYRGEDCSRFPAVIERAVRWFRLWRAWHVRAWLPPRARILDVGCGRGIFLAAMKEWGHEVAGTQLSHTAASYIRNRLQVEVFEGELPGIPYPDESFDLITMWHVLEHTTNPRLYLEKAAALLRPGGRLLVEVPNAASLTAQWAGLEWLHWDIPRHLFHFTPGSLETLLGETGFSIVRTSRFSLEYGPFGAVQAALNFLPSPGRHFLFHALEARRFHPLPVFALHAGLAALLAPAAVAYCGAAAAFDKGDILTCWCVKGPA